MIQALLNFLIGRRGEIFNVRGEVQHQLSDKKWQHWQSRYQQTDDYNWRHHTGIRRGGLRPPR